VYATAYFDVKARLEIEEWLQAVFAALIVKGRALGTLISDADAEIGAGRIERIAVIEEVNSAHELKAREQIPLLLNHHTVVCGRASVGSIKAHV
jgi:hypothetical protein